jgi:integrase/recombinase XerC
MTASSAPANDAIIPFLDYLKFEKRYSAHTIRAYATDLRDFSEFLLTRYGSVTLTEISAAFVRSWLAELRGDGIEAVSIARKISSLRSFFKYHLRQGNITQLPLTRVVVPKKSKRLPVFVKEEETRQLLTALEQHTEDWKSLNAHALISLFYATGMRLSELIQLKEHHLDAGRLQVKVLGKGNKERIIPVSREMADQLKKYMAEKRRLFEGPHESLFVTEKGKKLYPRYVQRLVQAHLEQAATLDKKSPHVLRHTFATHLVNQGAELNAVKELLGHSSLASTQVYTHNTIEKLKDVYRKAHPRA